ncbi:MAG: hypothetical protein ACJAY0_001063 [Thalassolituus sp.]|jgi:hypothetical protein
MLSTFSVDNSLDNYLKTGCNPHEFSVPVILLKKLTK